MSNADRIVLDTLGKLHAHGHGLFGWCRRCDRHFDIPLPALIAARGADNPVVRMRPVKSGGRPGAGSTLTRQKEPKRESRP